MLTKIKIFVLLFVFGQQSCAPSASNTASDTHSTATVEQQAEAIAVNQEVATLHVGAERMSIYVPLLAGKRVALVVNQTSMVGGTHLVDTLLQQGIAIKTVFAPEHGFRGDADAGEKVENARDAQTGLPIISLYGNHKEPTAADLSNIDVLVFDIQDVGARFYTYISTLHYVMQAAAKHSKTLIVLDRPNPNGHYIDGPILDTNYQSFVGMHPVPVVHGMTIGEYAQMINGEGWLDEGLKANMFVVRCENYSHNTPYDLPIAPSPNLPNMRSIYLYPSLCFFEGTVFSVGRGTTTQFQVFGHPDFQLGSDYFTPRSGPGAKYPKLENQQCRGISFTQQDATYFRQEGRINLSYILSAYQNYPNKKDFFLPNHFIDKLAGSKQLREQITAGLNEEQIRSSWKAGVENFAQRRTPYLIYD
jgi:uncharacterized protein YbbC (DUF1343 family)